ncbi:hypothetical protein DY000_02054007 [Brassica cretica]|uniref:Uncharacterized protein n=1 Tax=Brassica cretica TaxID=69181 RepID=A0ABQ7AM53_BRACR|nr:hypothetical protein DY000_02054007 [Brassica cretica]
MSDSEEKFVIDDCVAIGWLEARGSSPEGFGLQQLFYSLVITRSFPLCLDSNGASDFRVNSNGAAVIRVFCSLRSLRKVFITRHILSHGCKAVVRGSLNRGTSNVVQGY